MRREEESFCEQEMINGVVFFVVDLCTEEGVVTSPRIPIPVGLVVDLLSEADQLLYRYANVKQVVTTAWRRYVAYT